jgi:hypothetical protein
MTTLFEHPEIVKLRAALDAHKAVGGSTEEGRRSL